MPSKSGGRLILVFFGRSVRQETKWEKKLEMTMRRDGLPKVISSNTHASPHASDSFRATGTANVIFDSGAHHGISISKTLLEGGHRQ